MGAQPRATDGRWAPSATSTAPVALSDTDDGYAATSERLADQCDTEAPTYMDGCYAPAALLSHETRARFPGARYVELDHDVDSTGVGRVLDADGCNVPGARDVLSGTVPDPLGEDDHLDVMRQHLRSTADSVQRPVGTAQGHRVFAIDLDQHQTA